MKPHRGSTTTTPQKSCTSDRHYCFCRVITSGTTRITSTMFFTGLYLLKTADNFLLPPTDRLSSTG